MSKLDPSEIAATRREDRKQRESDAREWAINDIRDRLMRGETLHIREDLCIGPDDISGFMAWEEAGLQRAILICQDDETEAGCILAIYKERACEFIGESCVDDWLSKHSPNTDLLHG